MQSILDFFVTTFLRPKVSGILSSFHKHIAKLEATAKAHVKYDATQEAKANAAMKARLEALDEANKAEAAVGKFRTIVGG